MYEYHLKHTCVLFHEVSSPTSVTVKSSLPMDVTSLFNTLTITSNTFSTHNSHHVTGYSIGSVILCVHCMQATLTSLLLIIILFIAAQTSDTKSSTLGPLATTPISMPERGE